MNNRIIFLLAGLGLLAGAVSAYVSAQQPAAQPPAFTPAPDPYKDGIYANGIVESRQGEGSNINIFPDVSGQVTSVLVREGDTVKKGAPLLTIDPSVQREAVAQQQAQLAVTGAQIVNGRAVLKSASDTLAKLEAVHRSDAGAVSREQLDSQRDAVLVAGTALDVSTRQQAAQEKALATAQALLRKYTLRAPRDGIVMAVTANEGSYLSPQGAFDPYTHAYLPPVTMGASAGELQIRCYVDEILISRIPPARDLHARMYIRGTDISLPLAFVRVQPYVSPKIQLSDGRLEQVDVRVLPIIFRLEKTAPVRLYPGQLVDVYLGSARR
jgi:HlyD family secretion protein